MNDSDTMRIQELADRSGQSVRNLRAYLQMGLLEPAGKVGRSLVFDRSHLDRLRRIDTLRARGYSLAAIADLGPDEHTSGALDDLLDDALDQLERTAGARDLDPNENFAALWPDVLDALCEQLTTTARARLRNRAGSGAARHSTPA